MRQGLVLGIVFGWVCCAAAQEQPMPQSRYEEVVAEGLKNLQQMTKTLELIMDEASAQTARPDLKKLAEQFVALRARAAALPQPDQAERQRLVELYQKKLVEAVERWRSEMRRVRLISGGPEALQELAILEPKKRQEQPKNNQQP